MARTFPRATRSSFTGLPRGSRGSRRRRARGSESATGSSSATVTTTAESLAATSAAASSAAARPSPKSAARPLRAGHSVGPSGGGCSGAVRRRGRDSGIGAAMDGRRRHHGIVIDQPRQSLARAAPRRTGLVRDPWVSTSTKVRSAS